MGAVLLAAGCVTSPSDPAMNSIGRGTASDSGASQRQLDEVKQRIDKGEYSIVIPQLLHIISKYPDTTAAIDARYFLGVTYHQIKSYREAIDMFKEYLRVAPEGTYAEQSAAYAAQLVEEYEKKYWTADKLNRQIAALSGKLESAPTDFTLRWDLADLLWKRGDYEEAGRLYVQLITQDPAYVNDNTIKSRIERLPSGEYSVITPAEVLRREIERRPLAITNVTAFKSGEDLFTREARFYVVTGRAINRSDSILYGVQVIVTIYGFGNVVYDTYTVNLGRLNPEEIRSFSVRFSNFPSIHNIYRYEAVGTFQR